MQNQKNIFVQRKALALIVVFVMFIFLPFVITMFSYDLSERFKKGFVKGMLGLQDNGIQ